MRSLLIISLFICGCVKSQPARWGSGLSGGGRYVKALPTLPFIVTTGQSNANSHGENLSSLFTIDATKTTHWDSTNKLFATYSSSALMDNGFETQTAGAIAASRGYSKVYIIRVAQGSLSIANWASPSGSMWVQLDSAIVQAARYIRALGYEPAFLGTIYLQGEQDCVLGTSQSAYTTALGNFIDNYRAIDSKLAAAPFTIIKLRDDSGEVTYQPGSVAAINAAYVSVAAAKSNVQLIRPEDIGAVHVSTADIHFTNASYILIANAWASSINN